MASTPQKITQTAINDTIGLTAVIFQNTALLLDIQAKLRGACCRIRRVMPAPFSALPICRMP